MTKKNYLIFQFILIFAGAFTVSVCESTFGLRLTTEKLQTEEPTEYRFRYYVKDDTTGDFKTQEEVKKGDSIHGSYSIAEPNGDLRTVTYKASPRRGFEATVDVKPSASPIKFTSNTTQFKESTFLKSKIEKVFSTQQNLKTSTPPSKISEQITSESSIKHIATGFTKGVSNKPQVNNMKTDSALLSGNNFLKTSASSSKRNLKSSTPPRLPEKVSTLESSVKHFPGGFTMNISSKPQGDNLKTEMGIKFAIKMNNSTNHSDVYTTEITTFNQDKNDTGSSVTDFIESTREPSDIFNSEPLNTETENAEVFTEGGEIDLLEKEINKALNTMPKLPELILHDNETHFKFYQDPEEISLDERITQIARQLAETSLRREYEEQKLGHFIPISLRPIENTSPSFLSKRKSFKFTRNDAPNPKEIKPEPLKVLTEAKDIPQYIFEQSLIPKILPVHNRLPGSLPKTAKTEKQKTYQVKPNLMEKLISNTFDKEEINGINKSMKGNNKKISTIPNKDQKLFSKAPFQVSTLPRLFSSLEHVVYERQGNSENKSEHNNIKTTSIPEAQVTQ